MKFKGVPCRRALLARRAYHDASFGFRKARAFEMPDYTPRQLENRAANAALLRYVDSMRTHAHRAAQIDPLNILQREEVAALNPERYGLSRDTKYCIDGIVWNHGRDALSADAAGSQEWTLAEIETHMRGTYVGRIAYEYMHSPSKTERLWFSHLLESSDAPILPVDAPQQKRIFDLLAQSETLDQFLQQKFPNTKRYGLEGAESMIPALDALFRVASVAGVEHVVLGMPHRGRLNLLINLLEFPASALFSKIRGNSEVPEELGATGDVISHLVASPTLKYKEASGGIKVTLLPNPSHLEAVNPVALGKARAKQYSLLRDAGPDCMLGDKVMSVQLHGDAAFTGQGVVMECFGLSNLPHFTSGGTVHLVVNNNIGYTTPGTSGRSSLYCSDIAKMINAPVLHCNGDYVEDVVRAMQIAFMYRSHFRKDIVIDLITYRRWGHNELDEPAFTQPLMYNQIRSRKSVPQLYEDKLLSAGVLTADDAATARRTARDHLDVQLADTTSYKPKADMLQGKWSSFVWPASTDAVHDPATGVELDVLQSVGKASVTLPSDFNIHPRLQRHVKSRLSSLESGSRLDWATAEALAWGTLMREGYNVRISGQDVGRGTFSHRHVMFVDQETEQVVVPLNESDKQPGDGMLELANSSLSEFAVLGFEYGMSWDNPRLLCLWEAQFGDFFNGAQVIIDTFVASAETKWLKQSGLTILLPHGLDGAGPEHSSARIERWLQLTNDAYEHSPDNVGNVNMQIVNPTTAANYFHLLRRQMLRNYRKPLVVASPKGLLRAPEASSSLSDLATGTTFVPVIAEAVEGAKNVFIVSGKVFFELQKERAARGLNDKVALIRVEQLSPFPFKELAEAIKPYAQKGAHFAWVQEEPRNQGAWSHVHQRVDSVFRMAGVQSSLRYVGRGTAAVPGVSGALHKKQWSAVVEDAFAGLQ
ncbi:2-oxoglutarate dehydrogenase, E1 component [Exidia glandulosa HHB12029]|uniref:2-oxoglutarate dehydrogenase, E1 component n=1 Tax=Exidia glandulosa HHB12029 TaxID=1314781 RepID=A0A165IHV4_EXIGL|nr:2-oxoglutarate dehydrogenase, E1 component [Exidia glandulosa HHB12029]